MIYLLSQKTNTFGMLSYDEDNAINHECLSKGCRLAYSGPPLHYSAKNKNFLRRKESINIIWSSDGPTLVSNRLKRVAESLPGGGVEFLPTLLTGDTNDSDDYWAINVLAREECVDMHSSEYEQINFDPADPQYSFRYICLNKSLSSRSEIVICSEQDSYLVVTEQFRLACVKERLQGLIFYSALDLTYGRRTVAKFIL